MNADSGDGRAGGGRAVSSLALAVLGARARADRRVPALRPRELFDADALAERTESALADERLRLALAQPITDAIIDDGPPSSSTRVR